MDVSVSSRHTEVPDRLRRLTEDKIDRLGRFVDGLDRADVHYFQEGSLRAAEREVCEVTLEGHGHHVRAKVRATDGYVALDKAVEKLESQLQKLKTKLARRNQGNGRSAASAGAAAVRDTDEEVLPRIVKVKRFAPIQMTPEEAAQRMDLLGHGFFLFTNIDTHKAAVVYRRDDGDVGLIDEDG